MTKKPVKFRNNRYKTVGGVAPTRYLLSIYIVIDNALKWLSSTCEKSNKKKFENNIRTTCIATDHDQKTSEVSKESV